LHTVLKKFSENRVAVEKAIEETGLLRDNPSFDPSLAKILVTELLFGRKELNGESKPVQTVRSYKDRLLNSIRDFGVQRKGRLSHRLPVLAG